MKRGWWWGALACAAVAVATSAAKADVVDLGGLKSKAPADWKPVKTSSQMRARQFRVPGEGDDSAAEVTAFYFGPKGAGTTEENVARWKSQFVPPEGKTIDDVSKIEKMKIGDGDSVYVDIQGTYKFRPTPRSPDSEVQLKPDYRLLEGILQTSNGPYYVRLIGPSKTVEQHKKDFDDWLKAFK